MALHQLSPVCRGSGVWLYILFAHLGFRVHRIFQSGGSIFQFFVFGGSVILLFCRCFLSGVLSLTGLYPYHYLFKNVGVFAHVFHAYASDVYDCFGRCFRGCLNRLSALTCLARIGPSIYYILTGYCFLHILARPMYTTFHQFCN